MKDFNKDCPILTLSCEEKDENTDVQAFLQEDLMVDNVNSIEELWKQLTDREDYHCLIVHPCVENHTIHDILSGLPSVPSYSNLPIIIVLEEKNRHLSDDYAALGAVKTLIYDSEEMTREGFRKLLSYELNSNIDRYRTIKMLRSDNVLRVKAISNLREGRFIIKTREEAQSLASMLSVCAEPSAPLAIGLSELAINGVEHGMLGITFERKSYLINNGELAEEIDTLSQLPENRDKTVIVDYERDDHHATFMVSDPGDGFNFEEFLSDDVFSKQNDKMAKHGRGIGIAKACFKRLSYLGCGNQVKAVYSLK